MENRKKQRFQTGWIVFIGLAVLTLIEFLIGAYVEGALLYLSITALVKASLIIYYFMHISQIRHMDQ